MVDTLSCRSGLQLRNLRRPSRSAPTNRASRSNKRSREPFRVITQGQITVGTSGSTLATSEVILEETPYLNLTTKGRRTSLSRTVELWFAFEDGKLYFLAHENSDWWKNVKKTPRVEIEVGEILFEGSGSLAQEKLDYVFDLFRRKYGDDQVNRWYGGQRSNRRVVSVDLGRVLGKRPSEKMRPIELAA